MQGSRCRHPRMRFVTQSCLLASTKWWLEWSSKAGNGFLWTMLGALSGSALFWGCLCCSFVACIAFASNITSLVSQSGRLEYAAYMAIRLPATSFCLFLQCPVSYLRYHYQTSLHDCKIFYSWTGNFRMWYEHSQFRMWHKCVGALRCIIWSRSSAGLLMPWEFSGQRIASRLAA